jgi:hypothetical protein
MAKPSIEKFISLKKIKKINGYEKINTTFYSDIAF